MTLVSSDFMPLGRQLVAPTLADILGDLARQKYGTAKKTAKAWGLDPATAANLFKGHLSIPTLMKAVAVEGWGLWEALGSEVLGETLHQYEERKLQTIIREAEHARQNLVRLRTRREALDALARDHDDPSPRQAAERVGPWTGDDRRRADQSRDS